LKVNDFSYNIVLKNKRQLLSISKTEKIVFHMGYSNNLTKVLMGIIQLTKEAVVLTSGIAQAQADGPNLYRCSFSIKS